MGYSKAFPGKARQINATASLGEAVVFILRYECASLVVPTDFDGLLSGYRLTQALERGTSTAPGVVTWNPPDCYVCMYVCTLLQPNPEQGYDGGITFTYVCMYVVYVRYAVYV